MIAAVFYDESEVLRRARADAYERRLIIDIKKRRWKVRHSCTLCHQNARRQDSHLCEVCWGYEVESTSTGLPTWALKKRKTI